MIVIDYSEKITDFDDGKVHLYVMMLHSYSRLHRLLQTIKKMVLFF